MVDLLYGDYEGGQRTITRFGINRGEAVGGDRAEVLRYWNVDRDDPQIRRNESAVLPLIDRVDIETVAGRIQRGAYNRSIGFCCG